jgi:hypothetical protein
MVLARIFVLRDLATFAIFVQLQFLDIAVSMRDCAQQAASRKVSCCKQRLNQEAVRHVA